MLQSTDCDPGSPGVAKALVIIPGVVNYFYNTNGRRLAEALADLGYSVELRNLRSSKDAVSGVRDPGDAKIIRAPDFAHAFPANKIEQRDDRWRCDEPSTFSQCFTLQRACAPPSST